MRCLQQGQRRIFLQMRERSKWLPCSWPGIGFSYRTFDRSDHTRGNLAWHGVDHSTREEVQRMVDWCGKNNLVLNVSKTCEMTIDFRKHKNPMCQLLIDNTVVKQVESFKFLGSTISSDLSWGNNTASMVKRGQQLMHFLRQLKKFGISPIILKRLYHAIIESVLTFSITVWLVAPPTRRKPSWKHL